MSTEFAALTELVARRLWGEPNSKLSTSSELRFGSRGSKSVKISTGQWYDHETKEGGGYLDLIARETDRTGCDAIEWMKQQGLPVDYAPGANGHAQDGKGNGKLHLASAFGKQAHKSKRTLVKTYDYVDELGQLLFQVCRYEPKDFRQRRPDPGDAGKWIWNLDGVRLVPYRLPELQETIAAEVRIFIVEGEKDADALAAIGVYGTCNPQGAGKWPGGFSDFFCDALVCIIPDSDEAGRSHCAKVGAALLGIARDVKVLDLPGLPEKGDFSDWAAANAGPGLDERFWKLFGETAKPFEPADQASSSCKVDPKAQGAAFSEDVCALLFVDQFKDVLLYVGTDKQWFWWNSKLWIKDDSQRAYAFAREVVRTAAQGRSNADKKNAGRSAFCSGVEKHAQADQRIQATAQSFDADPLLLGTPDGTVDLRTGELRPPHSRDFITKAVEIVPAPPGADCMRWWQFLQEVTGSDDKVVAYLQRLCGYILTGLTNEECFVFLHGDGRNGKSTFLNTIARMMGEYAKNAGMETFLAKKFESHSQEIARLCGARLVAAAETNEGRRLNESLIKRLTGRDKITANFMRMNSFEFVPTFKIVITGNEEPEIGNLGEAMRRRIHLVPFNFKPAIPDQNLEEKLKAEWPGILRWCIDGCLEWQRIGLNPPTAVVDATTEYLENQDVFRDWFSECCIELPDEEVTSAKLFASWKRYAERAGEYAHSQKWLAGKMKQIGYRVVQFRFRDGGKHRGFKGLFLKLEML